MALTAEKTLAAATTHYSLSGLLGLKEQSTLELIGCVKSGLPFSSFETLQRVMGLSASQVSASIVLPSSTLARYKKSGRLTAQQSERLVRLARMSEAALELFEGDAAKALHWLQSPRAALGGQTPLSMASTELGAREVENLILRLEEGVFS